MGITIAYITVTDRNAAAPLRIIELVLGSQEYIRASLPHASPAHAGKISFSTCFNRETTIEQVIPRVPFTYTLRVHGTDEVTCSKRCGHKNFLRAHAIEFRYSKVWQPI